MSEPLSAELNNSDDNSARMSRLAMEFPTLRDNVPGVVPWNALVLDHWAATSGGVTSASRCAAQFLLHVWDDSTEWQCGPLSLRKAYGCWDAAHWAAFVSFVRWPFMP